MSNKNTTQNSFGTIIGNNNTQIITINPNPEQLMKNKKHQINVALLITFAKSHYAYPGWGSTFSIKDEYGNYPSCDKIIKDIFGKNLPSDYKILFKTIKKMYNNIDKKEKKKLKEIFQEFNIDYDKS